MKRPNLTWDENNLSDYLKDPQAKVKGARMPSSGFPNANDTADEVSYLQTLKSARLARDSVAVEHDIHRDRNALAFALERVHPVVDPGREYDHQSGLRLDQ